MNSPLVSIVLPTYNGERYLDQAIESCLAQTYENLELIIVDDACTDETPAIIARYSSSDNRIRSLRHKSNRKLPAALNTGFAEARGTYLTWISDDNRYCPQAISMMARVLDFKTDVDIVYADFTIVDEADVPIKQIIVGSPEDLVLENSIGACFLYRRAVQDTLGRFAEDLFMAEDYDFWLRASNLFRFWPLHQDLYLYRLQPKSLSHRKTKAIRFIAEETLKRNLPLMNWINNDLRATGYIRLLRMAQVRSDTTAMWIYLRQAMQYSPEVVFRQIELGMIADLLLGHKYADRLRELYQRLLRKKHQHKVNSEWTP